MIDYVMKLERENRNLKKDSEAAELFYYLLKHFSYRSYNPKGNYCVVAFTIDDENMIDNDLDNIINKMKCLKAIKLSFGSFLFLCNKT